MSTTRRGLIWEIVNSLWIILSFFGFSFLSFFYIGTKTKTTKWKVMGFVYLLIYILSIIGIAVFPFGTLTTVIALIWIFSLLAGFIHSFIVRKEYFIRRDYILTNGIEEKELEDMRKQVRKEYRGKDFIEGSRNDTHFDSTYHSNMSYRDYEASSAKSENPFEDEYYDEIIIKNNEDILDDATYVSYSKKNNRMDDSGISNLININLCSIDELLQLPGVNQEIAAKAISLREMLGGFNSVQEFIDMTHIDEQYINQIRENATVRE